MRLMAGQECGYCIGHVGLGCPRADRRRVKAGQGQEPLAQGLVGAAFKDEKMRDQFQSIVGNFTTVSSNLSRFGLLWKPKTVVPLNTNSTYSGRSPFR
jgi:hypothetical protein